MFKKFIRGVKKVMKKAEELIDVKKAFKIEVFNRVADRVDNVCNSISNSLKDDTESSRLGFMAIVIGIGLIGKRFIH